MRAFVKVTLLLSVIVSLISCSSSGAVEERQEFWLQKISEFKPVGKTRSELFEWQKTNDIPLNSFPNKGGVILEVIEGDGLVCSKWHILLSIDVDSNDLISNYSVTSAGTCL
ncbi:hypothetical protein [Teredinibacter purpureus]|uniref:hypothetical protein n=1 Tax=Teredinibacter purpureus TaxID=2731756 RepID=UPI0005F86ED6|nr:hypothetical protein [Teredinibacter purpureus]